MIVRITFLQNLINRVGCKALDKDNPGGRYLVLSKEGTLGIYSLDFDLQKSLNVISYYVIRCSLVLTYLNVSVKRGLELWEAFLKGFLFAVKSNLHFNFYTLLLNILFY